LTIGDLLKTIIYIFWIFSGPWKLNFGEKVYQYSASFIYFVLHSMDRNQYSDNLILIKCFITLQVSCSPSPSSRVIFGPDIKYLNFRIYTNVAYDMIVHCCNLLFTLRCVTRMARGDGVRTNNINPPFTHTNIDVRRLQCPVESGTMRHECPNAWTVLLFFY